MVKYLLLSCIALLLGCETTYCQVVINEVAPSNAYTIQNANGKFDDWIELYNAGTTPADLAGYGLTDDISSPFRFQFPSTLLPAGSSILVFAADTNIQAVNHYEMPVEGTGIWMYTPGSAALDTNWRNLSFDDSGWSSGPGGIGFSDDDDGTEIDPSVSVMMRKTFYVADTSLILKAVFMMDYDDAFVAYLNGTEIARANMSTVTGRPAWDELAPEPHEAQMFQGRAPDSFYLAPAFLKSILLPGNNVLAVETHDRAAIPTDQSSIPFLFFGMKSSATFFPSPPAWFIPPANEHYNAGFKLSHLGETVFLVDPSGSVADSVTFPVIEPDNSYGRIPDGSANWCYIESPTPLASNNNSPCNLGYAGVPVFTKSAGYYTTGLTLGLSAAVPGSIIRYTTNGDTPDSNDTQYVNPIPVNATVTLRARTFLPGYLPSPVVTATYFINENTHLPVFCVTTDSLNLWDENTGIYTYGPNADTIFPFFGANFWQPWSKPAAVEYYDKTKNRVVSFNADIEIFGNYSRYRPQKSLEIKLRNKYGDDEINYTFIPDKPYIGRYERMILRNSGTDWNNVHFRDALMQRLMKNTHCGYVAAEPVVMYLNGQFWGVYIFNEKYNKHWVEANYGLKDGEFDYLEESGTEVMVQEGSINAFQDLYDYATTQTPSTDAYYEQVKSMLDLQNFTDYFIANTYYNNGDWLGEWTNNIRFWRAKAHDTRFKYTLIDTDFGFGLHGDVYDNRLAMARRPEAFSHSANMFDAILNNPRFKREFVNRYADLINTIYLPAHVNEVMMQFRDSMKFDMVAHFGKWGSDTVSWNSRIDDMMSWVGQRPDIMRDYIQGEFNLAGQVLLTLNTYPAGSGRIEISTVTPESYPWSGIYFHGNPVTLTAIPNPGFTFDHWSSNAMIANDTNQRTTYDFTGDDLITAYFTGTAAQAQLTVSEINYNSDSAFAAGDWVELQNFGSFTLDVSGWKISDEADHHSYIFPTGTAIPPGGFLVIPVDSGRFKSLFPDVINRSGELGFNLNNSGEQIRIFDYRNVLYLTVNYSDQSPWPPEADGGGFTCELHNPSGNLDDGNNWFAGCYGGSPGRAFSPILSTPVGILGNPHFCIGGSAQLSAPVFSVYTYQWQLEGNSIPGENTYALQTNETGSVSVYITAGNCYATSPPVLTKEVPFSDAPRVKDAASCKPGAVMLLAASQDPVYWYDSPAGTLLASGRAFITPPISATTVFYARAGDLCPSEEVVATATIDAAACGDSVLIYPNPSFNKNLVLQSYYLEPGEATLVVNDMSGKTVLNRSVEIYETGRTSELELNLESGMYLLVILQEERKLVTRYVRL